MSNIFVGQSVVPVANCDEKYYNAHSKSDWILNDYLDYLVKYKLDGYPSSMPCLYLKVVKAVFKK